MYDEVTSSMTTPGSKTKDILTGIGLYQDSASSPYLLNLVLDMLTRDIQKIIPNCMFFTNVIILIEEIRKTINSKSLNSNSRNKLRKQRVF